MILCVLTEILQLRKLAAPKHLPQQQKQPIDRTLLRNHWLHTVVLITKLAIGQGGIHPISWCPVMHVAFVFRYVARNLHEFLAQIVLDFIALVAFLALHEAVDRVHAIGEEIIEVVDHGTFRCGPREWSWNVFCLALLEGLDRGSSGTGRAGCAGGFVVGGGRRVVWEM